MKENQENANLMSRLEAILFASSRPITPDSIANCLEVPRGKIEEMLDALESELMAPERGIQLRRLPGGVRLETKPEHAQLIFNVFPSRAVKPLSTQALETLALIALKQPITPKEINAIRGRTSAGAIRTLEKRRLIAGSHSRNNKSGVRSVFLGTTSYFLEMFGLSSLEDLYTMGRLEQAFGSVYGSMEGNLKDSAIIGSQSQQ